MRRSQTGASGLLLVLLGVWGGLIPFIGPYFHYAYTPDKAWDYTTARLWLEILPGAAVFLGGLLLVTARSRAAAAFGAVLAAAAGAWFVLGTVLSPLWNHGVALGGSPAGATVALRTAEQLGFFSGLGVVVIGLAALAFGHATAWPVVTEYRRGRDTVDDDAEDTTTQPISR
jgi:peptidoglycan/LPS O-acetylase OafA/YrhL